MQYNYIKYLIDRVAPHTSGEYVTIDATTSTRARAQVQRGPGKPMTSVPLRIYKDEMKSTLFQSVLACGSNVSFFLGGKAFRFL